VNRPGFCGNFLRWKDDLHAPQTRGGLVAEHGSEYETEYAEIRSVVAKLAAELDWPPATFVSFIDEHKSVFGVEPICRLLTQQAPVTRRSPALPGLGPGSAGRAGEDRDHPRVWKG